MGSTAEILVYGSASHAGTLRDVADWGRRRVELLEQSWSRFRTDSELSALNAHAGKDPLPVSPDMLTLLTAMLDAWTATHGRFDPTVLPAVVSAGYAHDFSTVLSDDTVPPAHPAHGMGGVLIDRENQLASLPAGLQIDPGGIGKGLAADIVASDLLGAGVRGVLVNLGGDIALAGSPDTDDWQIGRESTDGPLGDQIMVLPAGPHTGIATSSTRARRWGPHRHHVIDPFTGQPTAGSVVDVTVIAGGAAAAEAWATAAIVAGTNAEKILDQSGCVGYVTRQENPC